MNAPPPSSQFKVQNRLSRRKAKQGEVRVRGLLQRAGWRAGLQPASGASGTRSNTPSRQGDIWANCGDVRLRIEVKHHKHEPRALQTLRGGCEVLAYMCSATGRMGVFIDEALFCDLLAWSADALGGGPMNGPVALDDVERAALVDGEIARARLEIWLVGADPGQALFLWRVLTQLFPSWVARS